MVHSLIRTLSDAHNPKALAEFWAEVLGWKVNAEGDDIGWWIEREIGDPENTGCYDRSGR